MPGGNKASFESAAFLGGFRRNEIIKSVSLGHIGLRGVKAGSGSVTYRLRTVSYTHLAWENSLASQVSRAEGRPLTREGLSYAIARVVAMNLRSRPSSARQVRMPVA